MQKIALWYYVLAEADILKYQQQAILENTLCSNSDSKGNHDNDNRSSSDIPLACSVEGLIYQNHPDDKSDLTEGNDKDLKRSFIVNCNFARIEPASAETTVTVTRFLVPQEGFSKNFALEERNFNISVLLPGAALECRFIWSLINCEIAKLCLMSSYQVTDCLIQNVRPEQSEETYFVLYVKKLLENVSCANYQPWEEILLRKKPENSFTWDSEFCRIQKVRVKLSIKSSDENGCSQSEPVKTIEERTKIDDIKGDDVTTSVIHSTSTSQIKANFNKLETVTSGQNEEVICCEHDESSMSEIPLIHQKVSYKEIAVDTDIQLRDDVNNLKPPIFEEYPGVSISALAVIRRYVDELVDLDFAVATAIGVDRRDTHKLNAASSDVCNLNCSFCRGLEHIETIRDLPVTGFISVSSHPEKITPPLETNFLNSNPCSQIMIFNTDYEKMTRPSKSEVNCYSYESSRQNHSDSGKQGAYSALNNWTTDNNSLNYLPHSTSSIESADIAATIDFSNEFEACSTSSSVLHYDGSYSTSDDGSKHNVVDHCKPFLVNRGFTDSANNRVLLKESLADHDIPAEEFSSTVKVINEVCQKDETAVGMKLDESEEALQIECAIYGISERIEHQRSVTEAHAEASEELLKTILENIIINTGQSNVMEIMAAYKKPVVLLREKLADLEETLKSEHFEFEQSCMRCVSETQPTSIKSFEMQDEYANSVVKNSVERENFGVPSCDLRQNGSTSNQEISRVTPLTSHIKKELENLESILEAVEEEGADDMKELAAGTQASFPVYPDDKRHEVHNILWQINNEIGIIKRSFQRNVSMFSIDTAVGLLHKIRGNVSSMVDLISMYRKRLKKKLPFEKGGNVRGNRMKSSKQYSCHLSPCSKTGFFFKNDASVNFYFIKREESEVIGAIVKLFSSSDKNLNQTSKNADISLYEDAALDDKNEILERTGIDVSLLTSNPGGQQNNSFLLQSIQDQAAPIRRPRKSREMSQQGSSSPSEFVPRDVIRRSKSCDAYQNCPIPVLQNMAENFHEREEKRLDLDEDNFLDSVNVVYPANVEKSGALVPKQKSQKRDEINISNEGIFEKEGNICSCLYFWPLKEMYRFASEMREESDSMQLVCEDSDYAPEPIIQATNSLKKNTKDVFLKTVGVLSNLNRSEENFTELDEMEDRKSSTPELNEICNGNISENLVDRDEKINEGSKSIENPRNGTCDEGAQNSSEYFHASSSTEQQGSAQVTNTFEDEANSLQEIESIADKDEVMDEMDDLMVICNPHASVIDGIGVLPTIMEDCESPKFGNSLMSASTNTVIANIDMEVGNCNSENDEGSSGITVPSTTRGQAPSNKSVMNGNNCLDYKQKITLICESDVEQVLEETTVNVKCRKSSDKLKVLAVLSPELKAKDEACLVTNFDVLVEQPDEVQDFTAKILDYVSDSISLDLTLSNTVEVDWSLKRNEQYESYRSTNIASERDKERCTGISVSIIARSMYDVAYASLEEIPWGEVSMYIEMQQPIMTRSKTDSETRNSLIQNVTVSESNETEKRSLRSHESFRSLSQPSFDCMESGDRCHSGQNFNVPSYVVREGSTATITCEFNNFLVPGSRIDWFKGNDLMDIVPGKTDRISHDLLEVLVISKMNPTDGDIYSIRVNDVIYSVACLIVENSDASSEKFDDDDDDEDVHFISPPQTLFVMEGQPSVISCQVNGANHKIEWCKDNKKWITENERIRFEADQFGCHSIIIDKSELDDQGTYYAFLGDYFTTVTLVVEGKSNLIVLLIAEISYCFFFICSLYYLYSSNIISLTKFCYNPKNNDIFKLLIFLKHFLLTFPFT